MQWLTGSRKRRAALAAALLLAISITEADRGAGGRPGMDETIFDPVVERPKPV